MTGDVQWGGHWECDGCDATGDAMWEDEDTPHADHHDCEVDGTITWYGEWRCDACRTTSDSSWDDGTTTYSDHDCDKTNRDDQNEDQDKVVVEEVMA